MEVMENIRLVLSKNLKGRRKDLKINQDELAERSGLSTTYVKNIERGTSWPSPESFEALAKGLGISTGELLNEPVTVKEKPVSIKSFLKKISNVPDDIFDMAEEFGNDHDVWSQVRVTFKHALKEKAEKDQEKGRERGA